MSYYDRIDVSEEIDVKTCHDLLMMSINLSDIAILNIKVADYCCIISVISKSEAMNFVQNIDLIEKPEH